MLPTIEAFLISYESIANCNKRKSQPDTDVLNKKNGISPKSKRNCNLLKLSGWTNFSAKIYPLESYIIDLDVQGFTRNFMKSSSRNKNGRIQILLPFQYAYLEQWCFLKGNYCSHPSVVMIVHAIFYGVDYKSSIEY